DTRRMPDGHHTLTFVARFQTGGSATSTVDVTVNNYPGVYGTSYGPVNQGYYGPGPVAPYGAYGYGAYGYGGCGGYGPYNGYGYRADSPRVGCPPWGASPYNTTGSTYAPG